MKKPSSYLAALKSATLFGGIDERDLLALLNCLGSRVRSFEKGESVCRRGEELRHLMLLAEGSLHICREDLDGNVSILSALAPGEIFGEAYLSPNAGGLLNSIVAMEESVVIFFDATRLITTCPTACAFHQRVAQNLFFELSNRNRSLVRKLAHLACRSTREKVLSYLDEEACRHGSASFEIPFNRQQLADFLCVERSALSSTLGKLQAENTIRFNKNKFEILNAALKRR